MRVVGYSLVLCLLGIFACEQVEEITQRDYPFVQSIGITDLDETGATVNFEIKKNGSGSISEYGIEYIDQKTLNSSDFEGKSLIVSKSGEPSGSLQSFRISYDLINQELYQVKPFVKMGSTVVYGEVLPFESKGVAPPKVSKVSPTEIFLFQTLTIEGDFFHSRIDQNQVEIPGLMDDFRIILLEASRNQLVVSVEARTATLRPSSQKYDLRITSGGKSVLVQGVFSLGFPKIAEVTPLSFYVGDSIRIKVDKPLPLNSFNQFYLYNSEIPQTSIPLVDAEELGLYKGIIVNTPPGEYSLSFEAIQFSDEFPQKLQIRPTWQLFQSNIQVPNLVEYERAAVGEKLISWNSGEEDQDFLFALDFGATSFKKLPNNPFSSLLRTGPIAGVAEGRYFYYGLGSSLVNSIQSDQKDFYRLDLLTEKWEKLADFPFELTAGVRGFEYKGKFVCIMFWDSKFREYDPKTNQWRITPYEVPVELRNADTQVVVEDYIYYVSSKEPLVISRYKFGGTPETFLRTNQNILNLEETALAYWDGHLLVLNTGSSKYRIRLTDKSIRLLQNTYGSPIGVPLPWVTSQGLMMALPRNFSFYQIDNKIFRLIQDLD